MPDTFHSFWCGDLKLERIDETDPSKVPGLHEFKKYSVLLLSETRPFMVPVGCINLIQDAVSKFNRKQMFSDYTSGVSIDSIS